MQLLRHAAWAGDVAVAALVVAYVLLAPGTKVEESFNVQAMHDLVYIDPDEPGYLQQLDHWTYPGVVPRTFLGPLAVTGLVRPLLRAVSPALLPKPVVLVLLRCILGLAGAAGLADVRRAVQQRFGPGVARALLLVTLCQFHLLFYLSRPLPNTFALVLFLPALAAYLRGNVSRFIALLAPAGLVFRAELILIAAPMLACMLAARGVKAFPWFAAVRVALLGAACSLTATVLVDSYYWGRWLWPEGEVLFFNTALNRSSEWGVSPWHWYFTSAMPRALLLALPLALLAVPLERARATPLVLPAACMLGLYSFLPHKELRFVFYVIPLANVLAAITAARIAARVPPRARVLLAFAYAGVCLAAVAVLAGAAASNYPGVTAMQALHASRAKDVARVKYVHIDAAAATTGVSRFWESPQRYRWRYSKDENILSDADLHGYDYLVTERPGVPGFHELVQVPGFARVSLSSLPWLIQQETKLYVLEADRILASPGVSSRAD